MSLRDLDNQQKGLVEFIWGGGTQGSGLEIQIWESFSCRAIDVEKTTMPRERERDYKVRRKEGPRKSLGKFQYLMDRQKKKTL